MKKVFATILSSLITISFSFGIIYSITPQMAKNHKLYNQVLQIIWDNGEHLSAYLDELIDERLKNDKYTTNQKKMLQGLQMVLRYQPASLEKVYQKDKVRYADVDFYSFNTNIGGEVSLPYVNSSNKTRTYKLSENVNFHIAGSAGCYDGETQEMIYEENTIQDNYLTCGATYTINEINKWLNAGCEGNVQTYMSQCPKNGQTTQGVQFNRKGEIIGISDHIFWTD